LMIRPTSVKQSDLGVDVHRAGAEKQRRQMHDDRHRDVIMHQGSRRLSNCAPATGIGMISAKPEGDRKRVLPEHMQGLPAR